MVEQQTVVVVYCDGRAESHGGSKNKKTNRHQPTPMGIYRREAGEWFPVHSAFFNGEDITLRRTGVDRNEAQERTQYRWDCPRCVFDEMRNDAAVIHAVLDVWVARRHQDSISLAQINAEIDKYRKKASKGVIRAPRH